MPLRTTDPVAEMQLARQRLTRSAPELTAQARARWERWLERQATHPSGTAPQIHVISAPTCADDLGAMLGVQQLLGIDAVHSSVLFCLPSPVAARLFRAQMQRQGIDRLIHVQDRPNPMALISTLDPDALVCFVPPHVMLTAAFLDALQDVSFGHSPGYRDTQGTIVARAFAFHALQRDTGRPGTALSVRLETLVSGHVRGSGATVARLLALFDRAAGRDGPLLQQTAPQVDAAELRHTPGEIRLDDLPAGSEIAIEAETPQGRRVIFRQSADLLAGNAEGLSVTPPIQLMGQRSYPAQVVAGTAPGGPRAAFDLRLPPRAIEPWMVTCYLNRGGAGNDVIRAFAQGIGADLRYAEDETGPRPGVPVVWGVLRGSDDVIAHARAAGQYFFYVDHAYFERGHGRNYRVTRNGYEAGPIRRCPTDRIDALGIEMQPWGKGGREIIVCPPTEYFMKAHDCADWLEVTLATLKQTTDRPVIVRTKPQPGEASVPLPQALETAHALVAHSSNVAVEAVLLGTPVFVAPSSAAAPVGLTNLAQIEHPVRPNRDRWLAHLAYSQFSLAEMRDGSAWKMLLDMEERDFAPV